MTSKNNNPDAIFGFFNEIGIIAQLSGNAFEKTMPDGMTLPQFSVLNHLMRVGDGHSPLRIARAMQVTKGAMTNTLQHLEKKSLITVKPDETDGRAKRVFITEQGRQVRDECIASLAPYLGRLATDISPSELADALPLLERVRKWLDTAREQPSRTSRSG